MALAPREASMFACITDTVVAPGGALPAVRDTDAAGAFDATLAASPALNRAALRVALYALEVAPLVLGEGARLRRLAPERRAAVLSRLSRSPATAALVDAMQGIAHLCYYGDRAVSERLGYDAAAVVTRAKAMRTLERRW
jgi:hypothetical protein